MVIELAVDHDEAEEFCSWLNENGHDARVGTTTGNFVDSDSLTEAEKSALINRLWDEYCRS